MLQLDAEGSEIAALYRTAGSFAGMQVLEIGCGDGRLTRRLAGEAAQVVAIDPVAQKIAHAQAALPADLHRRVHFVSASLEEFDRSWRTATRRRFDRAVLAWSL